MSLKLHTLWTIGWGVIILEWLVWEIIALTDHSEETQPFTWYVRKIAGTWTSPMWYLVAGFLVWLIVHFLFVHR
jgi:hypothetical protein